MIKTLLKRTAALLAIAALFMVSGCMLDPINLMSAALSPTLTPESVGAGPEQYRGYECDHLKSVLQVMAQEQAKSDGDMRQVYGWHVNSINQVRVEKGCQGGGASGTANAGLSGMIGAAGAGEIPKNIIGINMINVSAATVAAMGYGDAERAKIVSVMPGLPAEKAGIMAGDVIYSLDGITVTSLQDVRNIVAGKRAGDKVKVVVWRNGTGATFDVEVASSEQKTSPVAAATRPAVSEPSRGILGVRLGDVTEQLAPALGLDVAAGALVTEVITSMPAEKAGIKAMDVILEVAGQKINSKEHMIELVGRMRVGYKAEVEVWRDRTRKSFMVEVASSSQLASDQQTANTLASNQVPVIPVKTGPIVYAYCFYTDVAMRKHWTSNVIEVVSTPGIDQMGPMGNEFYQFLSARNALTANEHGLCPNYSTRALALAEWDKTRKLYRFHTVQNNEVTWAPAR